MLGNLCGGTGRPFMKYKVKVTMDPQCPSLLRSILHTSSCSLNTPTTLATKKQLVYLTNLTIKAVLNGPQYLIMAQGPLKVQCIYLQTGVKYVNSCWSLKMAAVVLFKGHDILVLSFILSSLDVGYAVQAVCRLSFHSFHSSLKKFATKGDILSMHLIVI